MSQEELIEKHGIVRSTIFRLKTYAHISLRTLKNIRQPIQRHSSQSVDFSMKVIGLSESDLWNPHDNAKNWILTAGKIENLRIAVRRINGIRIPAGQTFSFWKQLGNPNIGKGYVVGREVREGCILPTKAGGLCQLSNAIYDAADKAGLDILERHRHTKVIKGSLAEQDRDATVKWNYVDLRFRAPFDLQIRAELTQDKLIVAIHAAEERSQTEKASAVQNVDFVNDCFSCGNTACHKHPSRLAEKQKLSNTTYIVEALSPEWRKYILENAQSGDHIILPIKPLPGLRSIGTQIDVPKGVKVSYASRAGLKRKLALRKAAKAGKNYFEATLKADEAYVKSLKIPVESGHLVVSQNLLPFLQAHGSTGGRTYDVLMTRLSVDMLQHKLDELNVKYPQSPTLKDFRAPERIVELESLALSRANSLITPNEAIGALYGQRWKKIPWSLPKRTPASGGKGILFPASPVGRNGAYELREILKDFEVPLYTAGNAIEEEGFLKEFDVSKFHGNWEDVRLVIFPTHVPVYPRLILEALGRGIPVIVSSDLGMETHPLLSVLSVTQIEEWRHALQVNIYQQEQNQSA